MLICILVDVYLQIYLCKLISDYSKHNPGVWDFYFATYYSHEYLYHYCSDVKTSICFSIVTRIFRNLHSILPIAYGSFNILSLMLFQYIDFEQCRHFFPSAKYSFLVFSFFFIILTSIFIFLFQHLDFCWGDLQTFCLTICFFIS